MKSAAIRWVPTACLLFGLGTLLGCNGGQSNPSKEAVVKISSGELPRLGEYMAPLDEGRLEAAPPAGWHIPARSSRWLARFQSRAGTDYPCILITAEDCEDFYQVTDENVEQFAKSVRAQLARSGSKNVTVKPVRINRFVGVMYHRRARVKDSMGLVLDRLFLETVVGGRKYAVELRTSLESLSHDQPYLEAVAAGLRFPKAAAEQASAPTTASTQPGQAEPAPAPQTEPGPKPAPSQPAQTKPPEAQPAETKPAEPKPAESKPPATEPAKPPAEKPKPPEKPAGQEKPKKPSTGEVEGLDDLVR